MPEEKISNSMLRAWYHNHEIEGNKSLWDRMLADFDRTYDGQYPDERWAISKLYGSLGVTLEFLPTFLDESVLSFNLTLNEFLLEDDYLLLQPIAFLLKVFVGLPLQLCTSILLKLVYSVTRFPEYLWDNPYYEADKDALNGMFSNFIITRPMIIIMVIALSLTFLAFGALIAAAVCIGIATLLLLNTPEYEKELSLLSGANSMTGNYLSFETFIYAVKTGAIDTAKNIYKQSFRYDGRQTEQLVGKNCQAFREAVANGDLETAKWIYEKMPEKYKYRAIVSVFIANGKEGAAFFKAKQQGYSNIVSWLSTEVLNGAAQRALQIGNLDEFLSALEDGKATPEQKQEMINALVEMINEVNPSNNNRENVTKICGLIKGKYAEGYAKVFEYLVTKQYGMFAKERSADSWNSIGNPDYVTLKEGFQEDATKLATAPPAATVGSVTRAWKTFSKNSQAETVDEKQSLLAGMNNK
ncbi:MAG: hypothetical protein WC748_09030 [Legionellales bacterium]